MLCVFNTKMLCSFPNAFLLSGRSSRSKAGAVFLGVDLPEVTARAPVQYDVSLQLLHYLELACIC